MILSSAAIYAGLPSPAAPEWPMQASLLEHHAVAIDFIEQLKMVLIRK
jgi:hypothetical protein